MPMPWMTGNNQPVTQDKAKAVVEVQDNIQMVLVAILAAPADLTQVVAKEITNQNN
jgi:hypothetical protein